MRRALFLLALLLLALPAAAQTATQPGALAPGEARLMILHDHGRPVATEMVKLTLRGEYDLTVALESLTFPDSADYDWMQLAQDRWFKERIGGRMIQIFERDIAVFPRQAGPIEVGPVTHLLTHIPREGPRTRVEVTSRPARLQVVPFPHSARPLVAKALLLTDELSTQPARLGPDEVLTRRVTIEALGTLAHHLPERPDLAQPWLISFTQPELRETIPTPAGPVARVVWEWQMRPRTGEPGLVPAVAFPWLDTDTRQIEVAAMRPLPFGLAGFGSNLYSGAADAVRRELEAAAIALFCAVAALTAMLWGRVPAVGAALRRMRAGPHLPAMQEAAEAQDLPALRAAAARHLAWCGGPHPRQEALLRQLDRQIFAPSDETVFAPEEWLAAFLAARRRGGAEGDPAAAPARLDPAPPR